MPLMGSHSQRKDTVKGRITELEDMSIETFQTEKKREKECKKKGKEYPRTVRQITKSRTNT